MSYRLTLFDKFLYWVLRLRVGAVGMPHDWSTAWNKHLSERQKQRPTNESYKPTTFAEWLESAAEWASPETKPAFELALRNYREMPHDFGMPNPRQSL